MYARRYAFLHEEENICPAIGIDDKRGHNLYELICAEVYRIDQDTRDVSKSEAFERVLNATIPTNEVEAMYVGFVVAATADTCADMAIAESQRRAFMEFAGTMRQRFDDLIKNAKNNDETE